jgi:hypothetical protein
VTTDKEQFICMNCMTVGELNNELRCATCDSDAVVSTQTIQQAVGESTPKPRVTESVTIYYHFTFGPFECFISSKRAATQEEALELAVTPNEILLWSIKPQFEAFDVTCEVISQEERKALWQAKF